MKPLWERHACMKCEYLGTSRAVDVYECFTPEPAGHSDSRLFTLRTGPLPMGGFAVLHGGRLNGKLTLQLPGNATADRVRGAIGDVLAKVVSA